MEIAGTRSRRRFLSGVTGGIAATSGCIDEIRNLAGRRRPDQLSLTIATLPVAEDPYAVRIANILADNLRLAGIDTTVDIMSPDVLFREILINHEFDLYVARYPSGNEPDELRSLLYSTYAEEAGWQNPFGFSDLMFDDLLDEQRTLKGRERIDVAREIQRQIVRVQPFTVVGFPDRIGAVRTDRFRGWGRGGPDESLDYIQLERAGEATTVNLLLRNDRKTRNWNPLAVEHRDRGTLIETLYEPLVRTPQISGPVPWLARTLSWDNEGTTLSLQIQLRNTPWHDGEAVTATDIEFTYEFLQDTSMGAFETAVPTPWRRGRVSLVESVEVKADDRVQIDFRTPNRSLAYRALSVPILPEHIWASRTEPAELAGVDFVSQTTDALVTSNEPPVGSGPLEFVGAVTGESLTLEEFREHFLYTNDTAGIPEQLIDGPPFKRLKFTVAPSNDAIVQLLINDEADASADGLQASVVPRIVRAPNVSLTVRSGEPFYHIGYNCRKAPMTDPNFRRIVARHIDREFVVSTSLEGYGIPSEVPLKQPWRPEELAWDGHAELPFFGKDGDLAVEAAQKAFREAGYQYDGDRLVRRGET